MGNSVTVGKNPAGPGSELSFATGCYVILRYLLNLSVAQFSWLRSKDNSNSYFRGFYEN